MYINYFIYINNNKVLVLKFSGLAMDPQQDLSRSITYILILHCILSKITVFIFSLINMSYWCINLSPLPMNKPFQATFSYLFINRDYPYL